MRVEAELFPEPSPRAPEAGRFASVALNLPIRQEFTYRIPDALAAAVQVGSRVRVPFGKNRRSTEVGVVVALASESDVPAEKLKDVALCLDENPLLTPALLELTRVLAAEYGAAWGEALSAILPGAVKRKPSRRVPALVATVTGEQGREAVLLLEDESEKRARALRTVLEHGEPMLLRDLMRRTGLSESPIRTLIKAGHLRWVSIEPAATFAIARNEAENAPRHAGTAEQERAIGQVLPALADRRHRVFLLHGVTGSGKTEVYLRVLEEARARGRGAIVLVPEIALTPQTVGRFQSRFPDVAVLHSGMTDAQRGSEWLRLARREANIAIGARSALFAPVADLGLVVVDEEHEASFKQQNSPRYHAREMAVVRGRIENAVVILGSATPSIESWGRAQKGTYELLTLRSRVGGGRLPEVRVVDMRSEPRVDGKPPFLSRALTHLMAERLAARDQVMLFLNRRGFSPVLYCGRCTSAVRCEACSVSMTLHLARGRLVCHYCMAELRRPEICPHCRITPLTELGFGTEKVEGEVKRLFPSAVVVRMDTDTMKKREDYERVLGAFREQKIDVLVGTQMIAKGLDFPGVTVVGVVSADTGIFQPDFRAAERTFQLLSQVAGRAGRGHRAGTVVIQTLCPENDAIKYAAQGDFDGFLAKELASRRQAGYPPYTRLIRIILEGADLARVKELATRIRNELAGPAGAAGFTVLGPAPAPVARIKGRHRWHLLVKCPEPRSFECAREALKDSEATGDSRLRVLLDVDPASML